MLGISDGEQLGRLLPEQDVQHGDRQERGADPDHMQEATGLLVCRGKGASRQHFGVGET